MPLVPGVISSLVPPDFSQAGMDSFMGAQILHMLAASLPSKCAPWSLSVLKWQGGVLNSLGGDPQPMRERFQWIIAHIYFNSDVLKKAFLG